VLELLAIGTGEIIIMNFVWLILLIVGFALVVVEMYIPGFGFPGITGTICLIAGVALYAKTDIVAWLVMTVIIAALLCIALSISIRSAAKGHGEFSVDAEVIPVSAAIAWLSGRAEITDLSVAGASAEEMVVNLYEAYRI